AVCRSKVLEGGAEARQQSRACKLEHQAGTAKDDRHSLDSAGRSRGRDEGLAKPLEGATGQHGKLWLQRSLASREARFRLRPAGLLDVVDRLEHEQFLHVRVLLENWLARYR